MSEVQKIIEDFLKGNNDAGGTIANLEEKAKRLVAKIEKLEMGKGIDQRKIAFSIATKSCEVLGVNITAEKLWSLVGAIQPILASGLTKRAADGLACDDIYHDFLLQWEEVNFCDVCGTPIRR